MSFDIARQNKYFQRTSNNLYYQRILWQHTRNGFSAPTKHTARKALQIYCFKRSIAPNVLDLSSGMARRLKNSVFIEPEEPMALQVLFLVERKQLAVSVAQTILFVVFGGIRALKPLRV